MNIADYRSRAYYMFFEIFSGGLFLSTIPYTMNPVLLKGAQKNIERGPIGDLINPFNALNILKGMI